MTYIKEELKRKNEKHTKLSEYTEQHFMTVYLQVYTTIIYKRNPVDSEIN